MASRHRHVGDVRTPDLIGPDDLQLPQQIRIFAMRFVRNARPGFAPNRFMTDLPAQPLKPLAVDFNLVIAIENGHEATTPETRINQVDFVEESLNAEVLRALRHRRVGQ